MAGPDRATGTWAVSVLQCKRIHLCLASLRAAWRILGRMTTRISVRIVPRASRDVVVGMRGDALLVRVTAPPVDGAANEALLRVLARRLGLAKGALQIVSGRTSKLKVVELEGVDEAEVARRLSAAAASPKDAGEP